MVIKIKEKKCIKITNIKNNKSNKEMFIEKIINNYYLFIFIYNSKLRIIIHYIMKYNIKKLYNYKIVQQ